jgi:hypothetical protein
MREAHAGRPLVEAVNHGQVKRSAPMLALVALDMMMSVFWMAGLAILALAIVTVL